MKGMRGYGFFILIIAVILIAVFTNDFFSGMSLQEYSYSDFKEDIAGKAVVSVTVRQNQEVPTGQIVVTTAGSEKKSFYAPDVNNVLSYLDSVGFSRVKVMDVETTPWYIQFLPYVFGFVLIFFLFTMRLFHDKL